jgi:hypothetical protein
MFNEKTLKLVTRQSLNFDITKDLVDLNKSEYFSEINDEIFKKAYNWLFKKINHDKFIWCYIDNRDLPKVHGQEFIQWHLEVPLSECVIINSEVWGLLINDFPYFDEVNSSNLSDEEYQKLFDFYNKIKEKTWDDNIFNIKDDPYEVEVLIRSPVCEKYVIDKLWCSSYDLDEFKSGIERNFFKTEEKVLKFKEIMESGLKGRKIPFTSTIEKNNHGFILNMEWRTEDE